MKFKLLMLGILLWPLSISMVYAKKNIPHEHMTDVCEKINARPNVKDAILDVVRDKGFIESDFKLSSNESLKCKDARNHFFVILPSGKQCQFNNAPKKSRKARMASGKTHQNKYQWIRDGFKGCK